MNDNTTRQLWYMKLCSAAHLHHRSHHQRITSIMYNVGYNNYDTVFSSETECSSQFLWWQICTNSSGFKHLSCHSYTLQCCCVHYTASKAIPVAISKQSLLHNFLFLLVTKHAL